MPASHLGPLGGAAGWLWLAEAVACPLSGVAAWLVWSRIDVATERKRAALRLWGWALLLCALSPLGADAGSPAWTLAGLLGGLVAACAAALLFRRVRPVAVPLLLPFVAWMLLDAALLTTRF